MRERLFNINIHEREKEREGERESTPVMHSSLPMHNSNLREIQSFGQHPINHQHPL